MTEADSRSIKPETSHPQLVTQLGSADSHLRNNRRVAEPAHPPRGLILIPICRN